MTWGAPFSMLDGQSLLESQSWMKGFLYSCKNGMEQLSHAGEFHNWNLLRTARSIPFILYWHVKIFIQRIKNISFIIFFKHHQHILVIPPSWTIPARLWCRPPSSEDQSQARCSYRVKYRPWIEFCPPCRKAFSSLPWWCSKMFSIVWDFLRLSYGIVWHRWTILSLFCHLRQIFWLGAYVRVWYSKSTGSEIIRGELN